MLTPAKIRSLGCGTSSRRARRAPSPFASDPFTLSLYRRRGIGTSATLTHLRSHGFNTFVDLFCSALEDTSVPPQ